MTHFSCKIQLLGGLRVQQGERAITHFRTRKAAALLAYLAYYRHQSHPREVLLEMLWPESDPDTSRNRLSTALWSLRRQLEPPGVPEGSVLQADRFAVSLHPAAFATDVMEFGTALRKAAEANDRADRRRFLQEAVGLYRGELLSGYYEDWVLSEQQRLAALHDRALLWLQHDLRSESEASAFPLSDPALASLCPPDPVAEEMAPNHLPPQFTRFFGREEEVAHLHAMLQPNPQRLPDALRLVTLTGPGGTGKTRLSLVAAERLATDYAGAVWFVPLAELSDAGRIPAAIVEALELPRATSIEPMEQTVEFLNRQKAPTLLLLDNFEHLVEEGAERVQTLLERVPHLTCLVTSRHLLNLSYEREFLVPPLPTPRGADTPERLTLYESVRLFVDRAQRVRPDFQVTNQNAPAVAELCYRLEGLPLAIELAAARAQVLTTAQMLAQMEHRFDFLVSRKRDKPERHRTLRAAIEWSYRLLSPELQRFFARLSVFRGGWTVEAAETVCGERQALDYLEHLRECSLVLAEEGAGTIRFRMLETLREFAVEKLSLEECALQSSRHLEFFVALAETATPALYGPYQTTWFERLESEHDNFRLALTWVLERPQTAPTFDIQRFSPALSPALLLESGLRLAGALGRFWQVRGHLQEGRQVLGAFLALSETREFPAARATALESEGWLARMQGDYETMYRVGEESLTIRRLIGERRGMVRALDTVGEALNQMGDYATARLHIEESVEISRELGEEILLARALNRLGIYHREQGDYARAEPLFQESLALHQRLSNKTGIAGVLVSLAALANVQGQYARSRSLWEESLALYREMKQYPLIALARMQLGNIEYHLGDYASARISIQESLLLCQSLGDMENSIGCLSQLGLVLHAEGQSEVAARLLGAQARFRDAIHRPQTPAKQSEWENKLAEIRNSLGTARFTAAWEWGRAMTWEQAIAYALERVA